MPSGDDGPLRQGAGEGLDWFSVATEASGGGTPDLGFFLEVLGYIRGVGAGDKSGGSSRQPRGRGARPPPSWWPRDSSGPTPMLRGSVLVHKNTANF